MPVFPRRSTVRNRSVASLIGAGLIALSGCTSMPTVDDSQLPPPVVFVHGNGDSAAFWQSTLWRFESNGWPRDRLFAFDQPMPLARDQDPVAQPGRSSTADSMAFLSARVDDVLRQTRERDEQLAQSATGAQYAGEPDPYKKPREDADQSEG